LNVHAHRAANGEMVRLSLDEDGPETIVCSRLCVGVDERIGVHGGIDGGEGRLRDEDDLFLRRLDARKVQSVLIVQAGMEEAATLVPIANTREARWRCMGDVEDSLPGVGRAWGECLAGHIEGCANAGKCVLLYSMDEL